MYLCLIMKFILYCLAFYFLYRFITRFVIPLVRVTRSANEQLRKMQSRMNEMEQQNTPPPSAAKKTIVGDYIDYEELK